MNYGTVRFFRKKIIQTLSICTVVTFDEIEYIYKKTKSFDKCILCLKLCSNGMSVNEYIMQILL